ncbi:pyrimidine utilization protein D [Acuticoccus mangrovi]|uniref:Pyrimidine utilization protein D n=1 Tax=Acuticoccus mangrovi TaxID=2796142 RepID=A0A934IHW1_9HYPH|nr:pyrimidine utilization protein D [Acuticoccus mangrovi]MBJ3776763.1 pyrimidine utilization protein D [Acuticoccus mangrovi]
MPFAPVTDAELYYEEHGTGFPVMMVAGLGGVGAYWNPQIEAFAQSYRVILHDHRGTGQSSRSKIAYSLEQMADDTLKLMDALDIEKAHLVGHSTGGAIAQILCVTHPDRIARPVMASTWTKADGFFRRCFEVRKELLLAAGADAYVKATPIFLHPSWWIRDNIEKLEKAEATVYGANPDIDIMASRIDALLAFDWTARLGEITHETLVLGVANDHLTPAYYSHELGTLIPNAEVMIMADGAHAASQTMPDEFNRIVLDFLREGSA